MKDNNCPNHIKDQINNMVKSRLIVHDTVKLIEYQNILKEYRYSFPLSQFEIDYVNSLLDILISGLVNGDRTGIGVKRAMFGQTLAFVNEVPAIRGKKINIKNAFVETMWILLGKTDNQFLAQNGVKYWTPWLKPELDEGKGFGKIYGHQMRNQNNFDQLLYAIKKLHKQPNSRQALINLWHGADLEEQALPCCHVMYHPLILDTYKNDFLMLHITQRSGDAFIGIPYDYMIFYFFGTILSNLLNVYFGGVRLTINDYHIYKNQYESINKYLRNVFEDRDKILSENKDTEFYIKLDFPETPDIESLTSETLTNYLQEVFDMNINKFDTNNNYVSYSLIKTPVAV